MIVCCADAFVEDYIGGAELTTEAILSSSFMPIARINSQNVSVDILKQFKDRFWIFGNIANLSEEALVYSAKNLNYAVIEYDYKFCKFRSIEKHIEFEGACDCDTSRRGKIMSIFFGKANNLWFMSEKQRQIYIDKFPFLNNVRVKVLSSLFDPKVLNHFENLEEKERNDIWLIQDSQSWIKGTSDAIEYAKEHNLKYQLIKDLSHDEVLAKFATSKGLIFLPKGGDTCPRLVIEAKLSGCELILNDFVQHKDEYWFTGTKEQTIAYLRSRGKEFWDLTLFTSNLRLPTCTSGSFRMAKTNFKIIVPTYNSEKWTKSLIKSVKNQEYPNFECYIGDDISTDRTIEKFEEHIDGDKRFTIVKNTEKKYALKNIYDLIEKSSPNPDDVIVVLDGDDWLTTRYVLSKLDEYYTSEECLLTYGSFVECPTGNLGQEASKYPIDVIKHNKFRSDIWRASHLKTFKYSLWQKVNVDDLKDDEGNFYEMSYDQAMMLPMLEMVGDKALYVPEALCVYNTINPLAVNKTRAEKQHRLMLEIRNKKPYDRLAL
tara:strand:+ start:7178 stop:8809 length:1632 start_codon:yes stop_codon:yes gene_type:complete